MKNLLMIALLVAAAQAYCQDVVISAVSEYTVTGPQYGASTHYETAKGIGAGFFYQQDAAPRHEGENVTTLYGIIAQVPLIRTDKLSLFGQVRGGLVNESFAVIIPGFETRVNIGKRLAAGLGMSMRMNYPSASARVSVKIF